ncbi:uncharacterized protein (TIGR03083 family) [Kibdelosporangium banguiense]|uniref:Uncharacterized protein (TIGR03083 family) n=1 Tax=Kibdelosporangium banguiense TaxID=1365924 RepID=A0ABS4TKC9_9PSEU|nr:maleylpyruvate isomerase N-terminal domain-containing protein [Kibdelosporangium banguiense]MBP2324779.1 uncharacterized protein (TIGR03083 family) [Kibdelosporangium banguiense]
MNDFWTAARYCDLLEKEISALARVVTGADLGQPAPSCPGWSLADVIRQTGEMFRWIEPMIRNQAQRKYGFGDVDLTGPATPDGYADWMIASGHALLAAVRAADPNHPLWSWGYEQTIRFWARRAYYNTAIHRADAELTLGRKPSFDDAVALDGIKEFLQILPYAADYSPRIAMLRGDGETLRLISPDSRWLITLTRHGYTWRREDGDAGIPADATIVAERAGDLLLFVWGRLGDPGLSMTGDRRLARTWTELSAFS